MWAHLDQAAAERFLDELDAGPVFDHAATALIGNAEDPQLTRRVRDKITNPASKRAAEL